MIILMYSLKEEVKMNPLDNKIIKKLFEYAWPICYYNTDQAMEMMCDWLSENGFDARWKANSIYINGIRCLAASFSHEERNAWALYTLRVYNGHDLKKVYTSADMDTSILGEAYLDAEEKFYDYRTGTIEGNNVFDTHTTGVSFYNDFLRPSEQEYLAQEKNLKGSIEYMTPAEYYSECATKVFTSSVEKLKMERKRDTYTIQHLNDVIDIYKKQFPMAIINYAEREQEGLHRMYVVGERFGWDTKHPVLVIRWADEDRAYREASAKQKAKIESYIKNAIKKASYYTYYSIDELIAQLQSDIEKELQYTDEFENVDIKVKLERDDAEEAYEIIVNDFYHEYMYDDMIKMKEPIETDDESLDDIEDDLDIDDWLAKYLSKEDLESIK